MSKKPTSSGTGHESKGSTTPTATTTTTTTAAPKATEEQPLRITLEKTVEKLMEADKKLCELNVDSGWTLYTDDYTDWENCGIDQKKVPKLEMLRKPGEANGKEHGKRFEENLKLVTSVALSDQKTLTKDKSDEIINALKIRKAPKERKYKTILIKF